MFFWNSLAFSMVQQMLAIWSLVPLPFLNPPWISWKLVHVLLKPGLENFEHMIGQKEVETVSPWLMASMFLICVLSCIQLFATPMDCCLPGSSVHWILQARILAWVTVSFFKRSIFPAQGWNPCFLHLLHWQEDSLLLHHLEPRLQHMRGGKEVQTDT